MARVDDIAGSWLQSHPGETPLVFQPADSVLEPARGRMALDFRPDGVFREGQPGPTDRSESADGHWSIDDDTLKLSYEDDRPVRQFKVAIEANKLVLTPIR